MGAGFPLLAFDPVLQIEAALVLAAGLAAWLRPRLLRWLLRFDYLTRPARGKLAILAVGLSTLLLHAVVSPWLTARQPLVHDEFSYLLAAETFLSGRVANPPHPMWRHWESPHVIYQPTFTSMYPPAQSFLLAAGKLLFGTYLAWPWLGSALLAAAVCWMLQGWVPPRWAWLGGFMVGVRLGVFGYWANSYWGGTHAALGGVLLLGAWPRVWNQRRRRDSILLGCGVALLALSRPFEGFCLTLSLIPLLFSTVRVTGAAEFIRRLWPAACVVALALAAFAFYNRETTGSAFRFGYQINMARYGLAVFPWQSTVPTDPPWSEFLQRYYQSQQQFVRDCFSSAVGFIANRLLWADRLWAFYLGPLLTLPALLVPLLWRKPSLRLLLAAAALSLASLMLNAWVFPHYVAAGLGLLCLAMFPVRLALDPSRWRVPSDEFQLVWDYTSAGNTARAALERKLESEPGPDLVLVRYGGPVDVHFEWVYNRPAIDQAAVVWAYDLGRERNAPLVGYFKNRHVWLLEVNASSTLLNPYPVASESRRAVE